MIAALGMRSAVGRQMAKELEHTAPLSSAGMLSISPLETGSSSMDLPKTWATLKRAEEDLTDRLPYRRYLFPRNRDLALEAMSPAEHWSLRADTLSNKIAARINSIQPSPANFSSMLDGYAGADCEIVAHLLESSAGNATDAALSQSLKSFGGGSGSLNLTAENSYSAGNLLAYLYRKENRPADSGLGPAIRIRARRKCCALRRRLVALTGFP